MGRPPGWRCRLADARRDPESGKSAERGRDADSIATTVGSWVGALNGESGLPTDWVETVCRVNLVEIDIRKLAEDLLATRT